MNTYALYTLLKQRGMKIDINQLIEIGEEETISSLYTEIWINNSVWKEIDVTKLIKKFMNKNYYIDECLTTILEVMPNLEDIDIISLLNEYPEYDFTDILAYMPINNKVDLGKYIIEYEAIYLLDKFPNSKISQDDIITFLYKNIENSYSKTLYSLVLDKTTLDYNKLLPTAHCLVILDMYKDHLHNDSSSSAESGIDVMAMVMNCIYYNSPNSVELIKMIIQNPKYID